jgi:hypothetical protein
MAGEALKRLATKESNDYSGLYAPLIGSWEIEATWYDTNGETRHGRGEWHFEWILGGLGVQDVLFAIGSAPHEYGTSIRTYDSTLDAWHVVWMQPASGEFVALVGYGQNNGIVHRENP